MGSYLLGSFTTLLALFIGYLLGSSSNGTVTFKEVGKFINKVNPLADNKLGAIERPTAKDIMYRANPKLKEEEDIMTATFNELVPKP